MRIFKRIFKTNLLEELQYKGAYISGIICQFAFGFMYIMLYTAFFENGVPQSFSLTQMVSYVWLGQAFFAMFTYFDINKNDITQPIVNGNVCYQLVKPINLYNFWLFQVISKSIAKALVRCVPLILVTSLLPAGWGLSLPVSPLAFLLFVVSLIFGCLLISIIKMLIYLMIMYTLDAKGVFSLALAIFGFLGGAIIPIPLFPSILQNILNFLPFRYVSDLPYRIYIGNIDTLSALWQIGIQILWIIGLYLLGKALIYKKSKKIEIQGG